MCKCVYIYIHTFFGHIDRVDMWMQQCSCIYIFIHIYMYIYIYVDAAVVLFSPAMFLR